MANNRDKYVRFYFIVSVSCLIPPNTHRKRDGVSDAAWEEEYLMTIERDLASKLSNVGFEVAYRKHAPVQAVLRLFSADFVVSILQRFSAAQLLRSGYRIKNRSFSRVKASLEGKIAHILRSKFVINSIILDYAASRVFVFENYLAGSVRIKYVISASDTSDAGGSVRGAIENFNNQVVELFESVDPDVNVEPLSIYRRPNDNIYDYDLSATKHYCFGENEVFGEFVRMRKGMPVSEASDIGLDSDDQVLRGLISSDRDYLTWQCLEFLPSGAMVVSFSYDYCDSDEGLYDYSDDLI